MSDDQQQPTRRRRVNVHQPTLPKIDSPSDPAELFPVNGLFCSVCGLPQRTTPGGASCGEHGGAPGVEEVPSSSTTSRVDREVVDGVSSGPVVAGFEARDGDVLVVSYPEVNLPLPARYAGIKIGGLIYTRRLRAGDDVQVEAERVSEWLSSFAERDGAARFRRWAEEFRKTNARKDGE